MPMLPAVSLSDRALAKFPSITDKVPAGVRKQLQANEQALHFAFISRAGGCGSTGPANQWLLVSNQRVLYEATINQKVGNVSRYTHTTGGIPLPKISFVGTRTERTQQGCSTYTANLLVINSSGGQIEIVVPSGEEARRTQALIEAIIN